MNDIPLIQKADINSINTSIIAIKKQLKQLNEALGLVDVPSIDTSVFVKKSDVVDVVQSGNMNPVTSNAVAEVADSLEPVDTVTSGNMHSVTSNAVANAISKKMEWALDIVYGAISSIDISRLEQGVYLVFVTDLYYSWSIYNVGILQKFSTSSRGYITIASAGITVTVSGNTLTTNRHFYCVKMLKIGYN